jgi:hypothetical protein
MGTFRFRVMGRVRSRVVILAMDSKGRCRSEGPDGSVRAMQRSRRTGYGTEVMPFQPTYMAIFGPAEQLAPCLEIESKSPRSGGSR